MSINVTPNLTYTNILLRLTCLTNLSDTVDATLTVTGSWSIDGSLAANGSGVTYYPPKRVTDFYYTSIAEFNPTRVDHSGVYTCSMTVGIFRNLQIPTATSNSSYTLNITCEQF